MCVRCSTRPRRSTAEPLAPDAKLRALTQEFMRLYVGAAARHKGAAQRARPPAANGGATIIVGIQRRLIEIVRGLLGRIRPDLRAKRASSPPAAMLYFGMINWTHTWLDPRGAVEPERIATLAAEIFLGGITGKDG